VYPPREPVDLDDVADMLSCIVDGAIIMSKTLNDPSRLERQILIFRSCVKLMFVAPTSPWGSEVRAKLLARCCEAKRLHPDEALAKTGRRDDG